MKREKGPRAADSGEVKGRLFGLRLEKGGSSSGCSL